MNELTLGGVHRLARDTDTKACVAIENIRQSLTSQPVWSATWKWRCGPSDIQNSRPVLAVHLAALVGLALP